MYPTFRLWTNSGYSLHWATTLGVMMGTLSRRIFDLAGIFGKPWTIFLLVLLAGCSRPIMQIRQATPGENTGLASSTAVHLAPSQSAQSSMAESDSATSASKFSDTPTRSAVTGTPDVRSVSTQTTTASATATASATPNPYAGLSIEELGNRVYGGGKLDIVETMEIGESFTRYLITYPSDGLTIYGFMNVPNEGVRFPVAIVLHGYITLSEYEIVSYTERYANALAEAGYFVIHPNFRNHPPSDSGPDPYRTGYAIDILNLIAIIREQSQDPEGYLRRADADDINLFGHSMGGGVALRVITVNNSQYLRTAVLYAAMSGDEALNYERIKEWSNGNVGAFELAAPPEVLRSISPLSHLDRVRAAISVHHSSADTVVPPEWSADLCERLEAMEMESECFVYEGLPHTFRGPGDNLFINRVIDFFNRF
jgi:dienelactone hydrolase